MFQKSFYNELQDYIQSGCDYTLSPDAQEYYNALYAIIGVNRKYGKDNAINLLMHEPFNCTRSKARQMYNEAINLFFADDTIENNAHRNMIYENLLKAAQSVLMSARNSKDMEIYGNLQTQAFKVKQLDKQDPEKRKDINDKEIKIYSLESSAVGIPDIDRNELAAQIDSIEDIPEKERTRLKRDAMVEEISFEEVLDDTEEKTENY
jgi:hypothetical protein